MIKHLANHGPEWPDYVPSVQWAMNTFSSEALQGFSPYDLVFLRPAPNLLNINLLTQEDVGALHSKEYVRKLRDKMDDIQELLSKARRLQSEQRQIRNTTYANPPSYSTGQLVALLVPRSSDLQTNSRKFVHHYIGPLVVDTVLDDTHVTLRSLTNKHLPHVFHTNRLRPWQEFHPRGNIRTQKELLTALQKWRKPTSGQ